MSEDEYHAMPQAAVWPPGPQRLPDPRVEPLPRRDAVLASYNGMPLDPVTPFTSGCELLVFGARDLLGVYGPARSDGRTLLAGYERRGERWVQTKPEAQS